MKDVSFSTISTAVKLSAVGVFMMLNTACGGGSWVTNASLSTYTQNSDTYGKISVDLGTSGLLFPNMSVPILDPKNPAAMIGAVSLVGGSASAAQLALSLNLTRVANLPKTGAAPMLPNGLPIPVAGIDPASLMVFSVGGNKSQVYVEMNTAAKQGMIGVAIPISQFDSIGKATYGLLNLMPSFQLGNGVTGTAGLFSGMNPGQNGFALFLDISALLQQVKILSVQTLSMRSAAPVQPHVYLNVNQGSSAQQANAMYRLYQLQGRRLSVSK